MNFRLCSGTVVQQFKLYRQLQPGHHCVRHAIRRVLGRLDGSSLDMAALPLIASIVLGALFTILALLLSLRHVYQVGIHGVLQDCM